MSRCVGGRAEKVFRNLYFVVWYLNGEVAEWFKAHAWKACGEQSLAGSNPVLSAEHSGYMVDMKVFKSVKFVITISLFLSGVFIVYALFSAGTAPQNMTVREVLSEEFVGAYPQEQKRIGDIVEIDIVANEGEVEIFDGHSTNVWNYNGTVPGPEIRVRKGDMIRIHFINNLPQPTTMHFHGVRVPNKMDGVPGITQDVVRPGESFVYEFTPKDAGTFWFHPHENSSEQLERGLYGTLIVEDEYIEKYSRDKVWVIDDWLFGEDYQLYPHFVTPHDLSHDGRWGDVITVNGSSNETLRVQPGERIRLRLVNVSNGRIYKTNFGVLRAMVIAVDGMYVREAFDANGFVLAPGNRIDVDIIIPNEPASRSFVIYDEFTRNPNTLGEIVVAGDKVETPLFPYPANKRVPDWFNAVSAPVDKQYVLDARRTYDDSIEWTMNGEVFSNHTPLTLNHGEFNKIQFVNQSFRLHPMHLHGQFFKVISRNGQPVNEQYFRDTVFVGSQETVSIGLVPVDKGNWLNHCHIVEHADAGMVTSIIVQ